MKRAFFLLGALAGAAALSGCSAEPAGPVTPTPAVGSATSTPTEAASTPAVDTVAPDGAQPSDSGSPAAPTGESGTTLPPIEQPSPQGGPWDGLDLTLRSGADVIKQDHLPQTFRDFLVSRLGVEDETGCTVEEIQVRAVHRDGYVFGFEESNCGGSQTVWGIADNHWNYIVAFQDAPPCADLAYNEIPAGAPGLRCTDEDGSARDY